MATLRRSGRAKKTAAGAAPAPAPAATLPGPAVATPQDPNTQEPADDAMDVDWEAVAGDEDDDDDVPIDDDGDFKVSKKKTSTGGSSNKGKGKAKASGGKKRKADDLAADETPGSSGSDGRPAAQPAKRARGKRGLLQNVVQLPLDLLFEIFGHLNPYDLVSLSRTSKTLRKIVLGHGSLSIWKETLQNIPLFPTPPEDISIPRFVELAFGRHCQECDKTHPASIWTAWDARMRLCSKCLETMCSVHWVDMSGLPDELRKYVPTITIPDRRGGRYRREHTYTFVSILKAWIEEYKNLRPDEREAWVANKVKERKAIQQNAIECEQWEQRYKREKEIARENMAEYRRTLVVAHLRKIGWAEELDKCENIDTLLERNSHVQRACHKEMTDRVLHNLEVHLNSIMETHKEARLERERKEAVEARVQAIRSVHEECIKHYPPSKGLPSAADLFFLPSVHDRAMANVPEPMDPEVVKYIRDNFDELRLEWRTLAEDKLANTFRTGLETLKVQAKTYQAAKEAKEAKEKEAAASGNAAASSSRSSYTSPPSPIELLSYEAAEEFTLPEDISSRELLSLAICVFHCNECYYPSNNQAIRYPRAIVHADARKSNSQLTGEELVVGRILNAAPFNATNALTFDAKTFGVTWKTIKVCGRDPLKTTTKDMDSASILECTSCSNSDSGRLTLKWDVVASHYRSGYGSSGNHMKGIELEPLNAADSAKALERMREDFERGLARASHYNSYDSERTKAICIPCHFTGGYLSVYNHVTSAHGRKPKESDIALMPDYPLAYPAYRLWPPKPSPEFATLLAAAKTAAVASKRTPEEDSETWDWKKEVVGVDPVVHEPGMQPPIKTREDDDEDEDDEDVKMVADNLGETAAADTDNASAGPSTASASTSDAAAQPEASGNVEMA